MKFHLIFASEDLPSFLECSVYPTFLGVLYRRFSGYLVYQRTGTEVRMRQVKAFKETLEMEPTRLANDLKRSRGMRERGN